VERDFDSYDDGNDQSCHDNQRKFNNGFTQVEDVLSKTLSYQMLLAETFGVTVVTCWVIKLLLRPRCYCGY